MKKLTKILALIMALSMLLSVSAFASGGPSGEVSAPAANDSGIPATANVTDVSSLTPSEFARLSSDTNRDDTGNIYVGTVVTEGSVDVVLDDTVTGPAYTAVFASGEMAEANVTGTVVLTDDTSGEMGSDFSGQGAAFAVMDGADLNISDATVYTDGFVRTGIIISQNGTATVKDSTFTTMGANPITEAWDGYVNSPNMGIMLSPPWVLGISGAVRTVNMLGSNPTLSVINSDFTTGGWAVLSTDGGSNHKINVVDSSLTVLPESKGGMDSGWRIFGYDEDAYGTGYGTYYIGNPTQNFYGATFDGVTYAAIITGANAGHYASSKGSFDLTDANGEYLETVQGQGNNTVINGVFGFMMHNSISDGIYVEDGTVVNTEDAIVIYKAANGSFFFDDAKLNSKNGVLFQMIDNDDDNRVGLVSMAEGFSHTYVETKVGAKPGFPGITYAYESATGGNDVNLTYTNGDYVGNIYNGTGYYAQAGDNLNVTIGEGATVIGGIALTSTIKGVPYSAAALEGIAYYGNDITYTLLDADGNINPADPAFIQINAYTDNQYFLQGHVQNKVHYNGASTLAVTVEPGACWIVTEESLLTSLTVAEGATVIGALTENADGTVTVVPGATIAAGTYGGSIEAIGGGTTVGGGVTDDGVLDAGAAAGVMAGQQAAETSGEPSAEPASAEPATGIPATANTTDVNSLPPSEYATLTNYTARDNTGEIIVGHDVSASEEIVLDDTVTGPAYTAVLTSGEMAEANVTGTLVLTDDTAGESASDFNGQGSAFVAYGGSKMNIEDATVYTDGFERTGVIVSEKANVLVKDSSFTVLGANPLTEAYDGYVNSANQNIMLSPPWVLGIMGGARVVNMIGTTPTLSIVNSDLTAGGWALLSTDSGSNMVINVVDTDMSFLPESEGGMDSGWRIFGYDEDAYGSGYGSYYIGNPSQYYYGTTFDGVTYAAIITGATTGHYASSNGSIDLYDATTGEVFETVQGQGRPTVINGVFGIMMHNSLTDGLYIEDGTIVNTEDAIVIYKAANGDFYFDEAELNSKNGVLFQMIDNDDDSRVGMISMAEGFSTTYEDEKLNTVSGEPAMNTGVGFPGINFDYASSTGGNNVTATYTNGDYVGNIYNGTGYYNQTGDNLTVTIGKGATLTGDIALTSTIKGVPYSPEAVAGIAYYGDDIAYTLLDADGNVAASEADAAYIQIQSYTMDEYFLQGHVQNKLHYNGASTIEVVVADGAKWTVTGESLITKLTVAPGSAVYGALTENPDGSVTIVPAATAIPAGEYGGKITAVGGGQNVGGGVTDDGTLDVEAAANALIGGGNDAGAPSAAPAAPVEPTPAAVEILPAIIIASTLSAEPSGEPSDEASETVIVIAGEEYIVDVYVIDGEEYVKLADLAALFGEESGDVTWADYQDYLYNASYANAPDKQEWHDQVYGASSWEDFDLTVSPWDMLFTTVGLTTWADFVAAGGSGAASAVEGSMG